MKTWIGILWFLAITPSLLAQTIPTYTIAQVRGTNSFEGGGADSNNVKCKLIGVVYGRNFGSTGNRLQLTLRDATGGIGLFKNTNDLPVTLNEGDSIRAIGIVNSFNGLSQLTLDSVKKLAVNRPLKEPEAVNALNESTESNLVKLEGFQLVSGTWPANPTGSGFTAQVRKGPTTLDLRVDNDCDLFGAPAPTGFLNIIGIGGQFDSSIPRNSGFQLLPRTAADITQGQAPPKPQITFLNQSLEVTEGQSSVLIPLKISFAPSTQTVARIVGIDSNAVLNIDYTIGAPGLVTFPASTGTNQFVTISIPQNSEPQPVRLFRLVVRRLGTDTSYSIGIDSVIKVRILDDDVVIPEYPISQIRGNNSVDGGCADSLGVRCSLKGQLCGRNFFAIEGEFGWAMRDGTGSIALYRNDNPFSNLHEGDSVRVTGLISQLNGLSFLYVESLEKTSDSSQAPLPLAVDSLSEASESALVTLSGYQVLNPVQWTGNPQGFSVTIGNGNRQYQLWLDNELIPFPVSAPEGLLSITGIGDQDDDTPPYQSNYRLRLVRPAGIQPLNSISEFQNGRFQIYPNPHSGTVTISTGNHPADAEVWLQISEVSGKQLFGEFLPLGSLNMKLNALLKDTQVPACFVKIFGAGKLRFGSLLMR
jgi:hypothetical protein